MTLGDSERLPLPHTKGTKPAPSTLKVLVYLIQVKKYFLHEKIGKIIKLNVPVKGLEPPLPCEKWILNPSRLPIPPHRHYLLQMIRWKLLVKIIESQVHGIVK